MGTTKSSQQLSVQRWVWRLVNVVSYTLSYKEPHDQNICVRFEQH